MLEFLINLLDSMMWVVFLLLFHGGKKKTTQMLIGSLIAIIGLVANIEITGQNTLYSNLTLPIDLIILCLYTFCFLQENWCWKLFIILLYNICIFSCNFLCLSLFTNIFQIPPDKLLDERCWIRWCYLIVTKFLLMAVCTGILYYKHRLLKLKRRSGYLLALPILGIAIISLLMEIVTSFYRIRKEIATTILLMSLTSVLLLICFFLLFEAMKTWEQKIQNEILKQQIHTQEQIYSWQYKNLREVRRIQHDMKHRLIVVEQLLFERDIERAKQYLGEFLQDMEKVGRLDCRESVWKTLLSMKKDRAHESGIICSMDIKEHGLQKIDVIDICILLGNLMDNAIEAEEKIEERRIIYVVLREESLILIQIKNRIEEENEILSSLSTTKQNADVHGFGIMSVKEIVTKYNGACNFKRNNGWFEAEIIL